MSNRAEQIKKAAGEVENWLDKQIVAHPRMMCVACGNVGIAVGYVLAQLF